VNSHEQKIIEDNLKNFIAVCRELVEVKLEELVPAADVEPARLHEAVRWSLFAGGKRFRPVLMLATGNALGAAPDKSLRAAAAIEMVHTYSLIHDDLPAILAGDVLQTLAFQAVAEDDALTADIRVRLVTEIARAAGTPRGMVAGQVLDLAAENKQIDGAALENIHRNKTGALIRTAVRCGAIIADASDAELAALSAYAENIGLLFQITDDLLDVTAEAEALGKTPGKDAQAQKATYVSLYGIERTREFARATHASALAELEKLRRDTALLRDIADYVLNRKS
jgi:geranylgeranyl diphosphate synthase type II